MGRLRVGDEIGIGQHFFVQLRVLLYTCLHVQFVSIIGLHFKRSNNNLQYVYTRVLTTLCVFYTYGYNL